jgi:hypothetical protein
MTDRLLTTTSRHREEQGHAPERIGGAGTASPASKTLRIMGVAKKVPSAFGKSSTIHQQPCIRSTIEISRGLDLTRNHLCT